MEILFKHKKRSQYYEIISTYTTNSGNKFETIITKDERGCNIFDAKSGYMDELIKLKEMVGYEVIFL